MFAKNLWDSRTWCVLGSRNEGPSRDWAWWRLDGWGAGRPRHTEGKWDEGPSLAITTIFFLEFADVFRLSVSISLHRASRASLPPRWWATTRCRLSLCSCTASLSSSLQSLLKLSLVSLRPSLLQFVSTVSLLLNHAKPMFEPVCVCLYLFLFCLRFSDKKWTSALSPCLQFGHYHHSDSNITFTLE